MSASTSNNQYRIDRNPPKQIYDYTNLSAVPAPILHDLLPAIFIISDPTAVILPDPELLKPGDEVQIRMAFNAASLLIPLSLEPAATGTIEGVPAGVFGLFAYTGVAGPDPNGAFGGVTLRVCRPNDRTQPNDWRIVEDWQTPQFIP